MKMNNDTFKEMCIYLNEQYDCNRLTTDETQDYIAKTCEENNWELCDFRNFDNDREGNFFKTSFIIRDNANKRSIYFDNEFEIVNDNCIYYDTDLDCLRIKK